MIPTGLDFHKTIFTSRGVIKVGLQRDTVWWKSTSTRLREQILHTSKGDGEKDKSCECLKGLVAVLVHPRCSNGPDAELG